MRKKILHRTTIIVVGVLVVVAITFAILRNTVITHQNGHEAHQHVVPGDQKKAVGP